VADRIIDKQGKKHTRLYDTEVEAAKGHDDKAKELLKDAAICSFREDGE